MSGNRSSEGRGSDRLAARRRRSRRRAHAALVFLLAVLLAGAVYGLRQSVVRISRVQIFGANQSLAAIANTAIRGNYFGLIPRDSTFLYPAKRIRADILATDPNIAAVSIFRNGLTGLSIRIDTRAPVARWCGLVPTPPESQVPFDGEYCYVFDASGFIYAAFATSTQTVNSFKLYAPLDSTRSGPPVVSEVEPLRATIAQAEKLPAVFDFARELNTFGSKTSSVVFRNDEVDDYLASGTRITYVLGHEQDAFTALVSARDSLNLTDGSIDYVDLRFDGKVYVKRKK
ncbi:hypothetical protein HY972_01540 [Candidatus Kaiserbacteria bacterium]|nr:hypothetical protein [Candidatus Kaiserbacteria bacterium]